MSNHGSLYDKTKYEPVDILEENRRIVELIQKRYFKKGYQIVRFTKQQKKQAQQMFEIFSKLLVRLEQAIMEKYRLEFKQYPEQMYLYDEYSVITYAKDCLRDSSQSMFACFNCGQVVPINGPRIKRLNKGYNVDTFHICKTEDDFEGPIYGEGIKTNWLKIRALFVENKVFKYLLKIVSKELLETNEVEKQEQVKT